MTNKHHAYSAPGLFEQLPAVPRMSTRRRRGLHGHLVHQLGQLIVSGELDNGPLVPEDIGYTFDVSRTVVRESLRVLEAKGLISARPNVGTRVRPVDEWNLLDPDVITWRSLGPHADDQYRELRELRWVIETPAARLAASQTGQTSEDIGKLLFSSVLRMDSMLRDGRQAEFTGADADFHRLVVQASGNRMLQHMHHTITACETTPGAAARCHPGVPSLAQHEAVARMILHQDADAAERAMHTLLTQPRPPTT